MPVTSSNELLTMICSRGNTFMSHGTRSTDTQKSLKLNAAHRLLSRGTAVAEAADILSRECGISLREAYRCLEEARAIGRAVPVAEPLVAATLKIPGDVLRQLRAYSATSGLTLKA